MNEESLPTKEKLIDNIQIYVQQVDRVVLERGRQFNDQQFKVLNELPRLFLNYTENIEKLYNWLGKKQVSPQFTKLIIDTFNNDQFQKSVSNSTRFEIILNNIVSWMDENRVKLSNILKLSPLDGEKNAIIIGANGAGKSSFADYFRQAFPDNMVGLPAQKLLYFEMNSSLITTSIQDVQEIQKSSQFKETVVYPSNNYVRSKRNIHHEFSQLIAAFVNKSLTDAINIVVDENNIFYRFLKIFKKLYPNITFYDFIQTENKDISIRELQPKESDTMFDINSMSDGEKVTIYYILQILLAPSSSTIIIDEPETYLNASIYSRLWDMLEKERSDCRFIYISHRIDFIESRVNVDLIWFKSFNIPDKWQFQFIETETAEKFPKELLIQLSGVKKNVLFCEGNDKTSLDYVIYQSLFSDITVIPVGNCDKVIQYTRSYNGETSIFPNRAFGIIDNDLRTTDEIIKLEAEYVFSTKYLEIEMLLCDEEVIKAVLSANYSDMSKLEKFKEKFIEKIDERKSEVLARRLKKLYENMIYHTTYDTKINLQANVTNLCNNLENLQGTVKFQEKLEKLIIETNYQGLIELCTLEHKEIMGAIANSTIENHYEEKAKGHLLNNLDLRMKIIKKYFSTIQSAIEAH